MKLAVVLIDMQRRFVKNLSKKEIKKILKAQLVIIEELCVKKGVPLVILNYAGYGPVLRTLAREVLKAPAREALKAPAREAFKKHVWDGFRSKKFVSHLRELEVDTLLLMGVYADCCVKATAESAIANGYEIVTASSLVAGTDLDYGGSARWYKKNGIFYESEISLLEDLEKGKLKNKNGRFKRFF